MVLVAGGPGNSYAGFHPWFSRLSGAHTVVYFDNIGRGRSGRLGNAAGYTVKRDAEDIETLRKALGLDAITLIGQSYGGLPALAYALAYPKHVSRLVLCARCASEIDELGQPHLLLNASHPCATVRARRAASPQ